MNEEIMLIGGSLYFHIKIKLEAKYFIIICAGFIDRRELLQITLFFFLSSFGALRVCI